MDQGYSGQNFLALPVADPHSRDLDRPAKPLSGASGVESSWLLGQL
jgi:hypothetical protein